MKALSFFGAYAIALLGIGVMQAMPAFSTAFGKRTENPARPRIFRRSQSPSLFDIAGSSPGLINDGESTNDDGSAPSIFGSVSSEIDVAIVANSVKHHQYSEAIDQIRSRYLELSEDSAQPAVLKAHLASFSKLEAMMRQVQLLTILAYINHIGLDASNHGLQSVEDYIAETIDALEMMKDSRVSAYFDQALDKVSLSDLNPILNPPQSGA